MAASLGGLACIGAGSLFIYGALKNKSPLQALQAVISGNSPTNAPTGASGVPGVEDAYPIPNATVAGTTPSAQTGGNLGVYTPIAQAMRSWGFSLAGTAGALGNLQVESGFNPGSYNPGEDAHGIANWEGGRWTALQAFGPNPGSLSQQLAYMKHELDGAYLDVYGYMRLATSPQNAAAYWDANYEKSSGSTRQEREANALTIYGQLLAAQAPAIIQPGTPHMLE